MSIITITLNRVPARFANSLLQGCDGQPLRRSGTCHMEDFLFHDRAVEIIYTVAERHLRQGKSHAYPVGGEMLDVIEINATDGKVAKLLKRRSRLDIREHGSLRFKGKRNEPGEPACFILQFAQLAQVVDALHQSLDMSIKHGASAVTT